MFEAIIEDDTSSIGKDLCTTTGLPRAVTRVGADWETLRWEVDDDGVATLTLHRPDALNAFDLTMARELERVFLDAARDDDVRAVVVTGAGRAFCAGMDLSAEGNVFGLDETVRPTPADLRAHLTEPPYADGVRDTGGKVTLAIHACPKPVLAAINGAAVGIGATMTLAMDLRLASTRARIGFVFGRLGIVPEAASTWFLPRIVGTAQALEWIYAADVLTAEQALAGPAAALGARARRPAAGGPGAGAVASSSTARRSPWRWPSGWSTATPRPPTRSRPTSSDSLAMWWTSVGDGKEGVAAFREKRAPRFTGRASELPEIFDRSE